MVAFLHNIQTIIGTVGAGITLVAFFLNQTHKVSQDSLSYDSLNFFGSALLVVYALLLGSIPFLILNGIWMLVSLKDVFVGLKKS